MGAWGSLAALDRKLRMEYPGAICHLMNRCDRHDPIFAASLDRLMPIQATRALHITRFAHCQADSAEAL